MNVSNSTAARFWIDKRRSKVPLKLLFPDLFSISQDPTGPVSSHWSDIGWNIEVSYLDLEVYC